METVTLEVPAMYGDHHVAAVRGLLLALPGVKEVYASSAFGVVEATYNPDLVAPEAISDALREAGYLDPLEIPAESGVAASVGGNGPVFFRQSADYAQTGTAVSFAQQVPFAGRPLWPCPGVGGAQTKEESGG